MTEDRVRAKRGKYIVGITGGIASGKTVVTDYLKTLGYDVIDADEISRSITAKGMPAVGRLRARFGDGIIDAGGGLDRAALANLVFADTEKLAELNAILHGEISAGIEAEIERQAGLFFLSAPLLFEAGLDEICDCVWLISAEEDLRAKRGAQRDGATEGEVRKRMERQMPDPEKRRRADVIIENDESIEVLLQKVDAEIDKLCRPGCDRDCGIVTAQQ
jgi:dephospho-CoA kinase